MHCREARRRMTEAAGQYDKEMVEHLLSCPDCSHAADAAGLLERLLEAAPKDKEAVLPFAAFRERVETAAIQQTVWEKIMSQIQYQYRTRPRLLTGLGLTAFVFLVLTLIPFSYDRVVGYDIHVAGIPGGGAPSPELVAAGMTAIGRGDITVAAGETTGDYRVLGNITEPEARVIAKIMARIARSVEEPQLKAIRKAISGTLYAQVAEKVKQATAEKKEPTAIRMVNGELIIDQAVQDSLFGNLGSDDCNDIKKTMERIFNKLGCTDANITVIAEDEGDDGTRTIQMVLPRKSDSLKNFALTRRQGDTSQRAVSGIQGTQKEDTLLIKFDIKPKKP